MNDKPISRFDLVHLKAARIRDARTAQSTMRAEAMGAKIEPISEARTAGLDDVVREERSRGLNDGTRWVGRTSGDPAKSRTR